MILKHSMKSIIRTPKKTVLFLFLLIVLTIILCIGAGMYMSARNMLSDADKTFTSLVKLDYLGDLGGDAASLYESMNSDLEDFSFDKLETHPDVKAVGMEETAWAYIEGDTMKRPNTPFYNYSIVKLSNMLKYEDDPYKGTVKEILFGKRVRENTYMMINDRDATGTQTDYNFLPGHEYLVIGRIDTGRNPTLILFPGLAEVAKDIPYIVDLTEQPDFLNSDEGKRITDLQEAMTAADNSLLVIAVSNLEASAPYYFGEMRIKKGRIFDPSEYQEDNNEVILISETLADFYQVEPGEKLNLKLHYSKNGMEPSHILTDNKFDHEASYTVVGIFENKDDNRYVIYMPKTGWMEQKPNSTTLARYIVKNGRGTKFIEDNRSSLLPNMELTLYDQGYAEAVKPIVALKNSALMIIVLGSLFAVAILMLFSYLYVMKQKDTLKTMLSLGTGKRRTMGYILSGVAALIFCASFAGAAASFGFLDKVTGVLFETMQNTYGTDLRYSERGAGLQVDFVPQVKVELWLPALAVLFVLFIGFVILFLFTYSVLREDEQVSLRKGMKKDRIALPAKTRIKKMMFKRARPITLKFALISLTRSPGRSFIIPFISMLLSFFIIFLGLLSSTQQEKLATVYDRIPVTAYITSSGDQFRALGGLDLQYDIYRLIDPEYNYRLQWDMEMYNDYMENGDYTSLRAQEERDGILAGSKYFAQMYLYAAARYEYMGISKTREGEDEELSRRPNIRRHDNDYGYDWFLVEMNKMPQLAYADDISYTPDFFNSSGPEVEFLEGYGFDSLRLRENIGIISKGFAAAHGIENGDTIRLTAWINYDERAVCSVIDLKVAGIYYETGQENTIYIPWIMSYDHSYYVDYNYPADGEEDKQSEIWNESLPRSVKAATFTLKDTKDLTAFRDYLEAEGYSQIGKMSMNRRVIVIQDKRLVETIQTLRNHIRLMDTIKPIMLVLFGIIGFAVSFILIRHRMNELAIMRSMGAKKRHVFFSFFLEQLILFLIGLVPAAAYMLTRLDKASLYGASLAYFILCYLAGTALALIIMNGAKILNILFTKE
jgi:ABC-type lipoprotein release transport system permease subunit